MITTITLNAAVDKLYLVDDIKLDTVMRVKEVINTAGGKGINVAKVAALAGENVSAMGFLGGNSGQYVLSMLNQAGIICRFTQTKNETRSCINVRNMSTGKHTEFLEPGASVTQEEVKAFLNSYQKMLPVSDIITISGSVPAGIPSNFYADMILQAKKLNKPVVLDTSGTLLSEGIKAKPTLVKPNIDEISQLLEIQIKDSKDVIAAAEKLYSYGIPYVVVSLGKEGSVMVSKNGVYTATPPEVPVANTVGCGDSMVAALAIGIIRGYSDKEMLSYASAVSASNAQSSKTGHIERNDLPKLMSMAKTQKLKEGNSQ